MLYSILLIVALFVVFRMYSKKTQSLTSEQKKKMLRMWLLIGAAIAVAVLAFSKGNVIAGAIASMVALFSRALPLLRFAPLVKTFMDKQTGSSPGSQGQSGSKASVIQNMDKAQAADILGVDIDASKNDIIAAHKRLMQKVHPDKGGSDALAIQINEAKKVLLGE